MKRYVSMTLALVVFITFTTSCKSAKEFANLAQAGTTYAAAMDKLLVATQEIEIDTTSERLLQDDSLSNQSLVTYRKLSDENEKTLQLIVLLRQHVRLLSRYFGLLQELATSNAPQRAKAAIGGVLTNLNSVSTAIRGTGLVSSGAATATGLITSAIVNAKIRGALKEELNARRETIEKELLLQEELLKFLSKQINHDLTLIQQTREQRLVIDPLTSTTPVSSPDTWINNRRSVLTMRLTAQELTTASNNIEKLREAFQDLVSGKLTFDRVNSLLTDFEALLTIAEQLKKS